MLSKKIVKNLFVPKNKYEHDVLNLYLLLVENSKQTFFVGGTVRDLLLGIRPKDFDIATQAEPENVSKLLKLGGYNLDFSAIRFGIVKVNISGQQIEVTSFRKELYENSRYPKITFTKSLELDSKRRDYTINALYFQGKTETLLDAHNGLKDIKAKKLNLIGDGETRLNEDPLRIVRGYRLAKDLELGFSRSTAAIIHNNFFLIRKLSRSRLTQEINKSKSVTTRKYLQKLFAKYLHKKK